MEYEISWFIHQRVVQSQIRGHASIKALVAFSDALAETFLDAGRAPVHLLLDVTLLESAPSSLERIEYALRSSLSHDSIGEIILIGGHKAVTSFLIEAAAEASGCRLHAVDRIQEADTILHTLIYGAV